MEFTNLVTSDAMENSKHGKVKTPLLSSDSKTHEPRNGGDHTQRTGRLLLWKSMAANYWTWEVASATLSIATFLLIISVLIAYDQQPAPSLPRGITLNAMISFLSTIAKGFMMVSVAATISQSKWLWYSGGSRRVHDFQVFEDASRGPLGSLYLLFRGKNSCVLASLGALLTILAIFIEPFIQQLLVFKLRNVTSNDLQSNIAAPVAFGTLDSFPVDDLLKATMVGIIGGDSNLHTKPDCPTGNCIWPNYYALAMCSSCADVKADTSVSGHIWDVNVTDILLRRHQNYTDEERLHYLNEPAYFVETFTLPHGLPQNVTIETTSLDDLNWDDPFIRYLGSWPDKVIWPLNLLPANDNMAFGNFFDLWRNETIAGIDGPLLALGYLNLDAVNISDFRRLEVVEALECAFTPCVHEYQSRMTAGKLESSIISTTYTVLEDFGNFNGSCNVTVNGTSFQLGSLFAMNGTVVGLLDAFEGTTEAEAYADCTENARGGLDCRYYNVYGQYNSDLSATAIEDATAFMKNPSYASGQITGSHFTQLVEDVATSVTNLMGFCDDRRAYGTVLVPETYVYVRWIWIAYPIVLALLALTLLFGIMLQTRRSEVEVWKSSMMPLIYRYQRNALRHDSVDGQQDEKHLSDLNHVAKQDHVRLITSTSGGLAGMLVVQEQRECQNQAPGE